MALPTVTIKKQIRGNNSTKLFQLKVIIQIADGHYQKVLSATNPTTGVVHTLTPRQKKESMVDYTNAFQQSGHQVRGRGRVSHRVIR